MTRTCRIVHTLRFHAVSPRVALSPGTLLCALAFISRVLRWRSRPVSHVPGYVCGIWFYRPRAFAYTGAGILTLVHMCRLRDAAFSYFVVDAEATITLFRAQFISVNALVSSNNDKHEFQIKFLKSWKNHFFKCHKFTMPFNRRNELYVQNVKRRKFMFYFHAKRCGKKS